MLLIASREGERGMFPAGPESRYRLSSIPTYTSQDNFQIHSIFHARRDTRFWAINHQEKEPMAVKLKLTRLGSKKHPFYRVVAANDQTARDGRPLEFLGYYNPMTHPHQVKLDAEKIRKWLDCGAQPTDTVAALLRKHLDKAAGE